MNSLVPSGTDVTALDQRANLPSSPIGMLPPNPEGAVLLQYFSLLLKRRWTIIGTMVIVTTLGTIFTLRSPKRYEAVGRIAYNREPSLNLGMKDSDFSGSSIDDLDYNVALETQVKILQSDAVALATIKSLKLDADPKFAGPAAANGGKEMQTLSVDSPLQSSLIGRFRGGLKVNVIPRTRIIEIHYTDQDPRLAATLVNGLASAYMAQNLKSHYESVMQTSDWLSKQLSDLQLKVESSQAKLVAYQRERGIVGLDEKRNIVTQKLDDINKELSSAEADRMKKEASYRLVRSGQIGAVGDTTGVQTLANLRTKETDLEVQVAQANTQFGPSYPTVVSLKSQLKQVQTSIANETKRVEGAVRDEYLAAVQRERLLRDALEAQKVEANKLNENAIEYDALKRDADSNRQLFDGLQQRMKEASVAAGLKSSNVWVVDNARVPTGPSSPNVPRNILMSVFLGLAGGFGLAFVLESIDHTVRTYDDAENAAVAPVLAIIPGISHMPAGKVSGGVQKLLGGAPAAATAGGRAELVCYSRPRSQVSEAYRALRTSLMLSSAEAPPKIIVVTSPLPQEGKTTTSINTAVVLAQAGARVLLVDADMRRPAVHRALKLRNDAGLSTLLASTANPSSYIMSTDVANLFAVAAGPTPPQPAELLCSARMRAVLGQWTREFDHVVIDTPPALTVTDSVVLSVLADAIVLVARSGQTSKTALRRSRALLGRVCKSVGVVVNDMKLNSAEYSYYYGYGAKYYNRYYDEAHRR